VETLAITVSVGRPLQRVKQVGEQGWESAVDFGALTKEATYPFGNKKNFVQRVIKPRLN
jgi:hypothetical protein